jgi:hypothetical protein
MSQRADQPETIEGEVIYFPPQPQQTRHVAYDPSRTIRRPDPNQTQVRRSGLFGWGENQEDVTHRETLIRDNHLAEEAINMEANAVRAEVSGVALTVQGAGAVLEIVERTVPNTTLGRFTEDLAGGSLARQRDNHSRFQESLTNEQLNLFHNRHR